MVHRELFKLVCGINRTVINLSKEKCYYPPKVRLYEDMSSSELLSELDKLERFLRVPYLSYLTKNESDKKVN